MKAALQAKLLAQADTKGFILFKDAVFLDTDNDNLTSSQNGDGTLTLALKGTLYGILFNEQDLTKKIATDSIDGYDGSNVYIPNIKDLNFTLNNKDGISLGDIANINFNLSGPTQIVYKVDTNKLIGDLLGKSKKDFNQILLQYPNIDSANLSISPVWKFSIPDKTKDIKIIVNYPK